MLQNQPLKLDVNTSTDWPLVTATIVVGFASASIAYVASKLSSKNQKYQIKSSIANFRHKWMEDLRETTSLLLSKLAMLSYEIDSNPDYMKSSESNKLYGEILQLESKIFLMLGKSTLDHDNIRSLVININIIVRENKKGDLNDSLDNLNNSMMDVLEAAWKDIKNDLSGNIE